MTVNQDFQARRLVDQPSGMPTRKVAFAGVGGALAIIVVFVFSSIFPSVTIPEEVGAAVATILSFGFAYFFRDKEPA